MSALHLYLPFTFRQPGHEGGAKHGGQLLSGGGLQTSFPGLYDHSPPGAPRYQLSLHTPPPPEGFLDTIQPGANHCLPHSCGDARSPRV